MRPPLIRSATAKSSAVLTGSCSGSSTAPIWIRIFLVRAAIAAAKTNGEGR
jgi:hypothetical protein